MMMTRHWDITSYNILNMKLKIKFSSKIIEGTVLWQQAQRCAADNNIKKLVKQFFNWLGNFSKMLKIIQNQGLFQNILHITGPDFFGNILIRIRMVCMTNTGHSPAGRYGTFL